MLEIMGTIFVITVGVAMGAVILAYALYITLFPLVKTVGGGLEVIRAYREKRAPVAEGAKELIPHAELGFTLADGGEEIKKEED